MLLYIRHWRLRGEDMTATQTPAELGAAIMRRYRHPESWVDGATTMKLHHRGKKILKVEEIRLGGMGLVSEQEARANAAAIRAFAQANGIPPYKLLIDQVPDKAPYVMVPDQYFTSDVLPVLVTL